MNANLKLKLKLVSLVMLLLVSVLSAVHASQYHLECGESPTSKYKELAKAIGWDWYQLIRFIKTEKPDEYEKILKSVKLYADCLDMIQIPI